MTRLLPEWLCVQNETDFEEWIPRDKEVKVIIDSHKSDRAPGVDGVLAEVLKQASVDFVQVLTDQINRVLEAEEVPEMLQTGEMTLIDKKKTVIGDSEQETSNCFEYISKCNS